MKTLKLLAPSSVTATRCLFDLLPWEMWGHNFHAGYQEGCAYNKGKLEHWSSMCAASPAHNHLWNSDIKSGWGVCGREGVRMRVWECVCACVRVWECVCVCVPCCSSRHAHTWQIIITICQPYIYIYMGSCCCDWRKFMTDDPKKVIFLVDDWETEQVGTDQLALTPD